MTRTHGALELPKVVLMHGDLSRQMSLQYMNLHTRHRVRPSTVIACPCLCYLSPCFWFWRLNGKVVSTVLLDVWFDVEDGFTHVNILHDWLLK